jgi:DNA polymerase/3'-5' exonuclease PolX
LRVVSDAEFPFALAYFTGSKEHNIVMRQRAIQRGLRLNEYGLFKSKEETRDPKLLVPCQTEEEIFESWICRSCRRNCARTTANLPRRKRTICRSSSSGRI